MFVFLITKSELVMIRARPEHFILRNTILVHFYTEFDTFHFEICEIFVENTKTGCTVADSLTFS